MTDKEHIKNLNDGESYTVPESDYGKAEIFFTHGMYFLFEIPMYGGQPIFSKAFCMENIDSMIKTYTNWT